MKENERTNGGEKRVLTSRAGSRMFGILISYWGVILVGSFLLAEIIEAGSLTHFLQRFGQPWLILVHSLLLLSIPAFMVVGYFYQRLMDDHKRIERAYMCVEEKNRELKETQKQLLKAERLATIGELASMVGHDLRNPLTSIATSTYYLKMKLGSKTDKKMKKMLERIEKSIEHSNNIISDLLEYSRKMRLELTETTPKSILKEALQFVQVPRNVEVINTTLTESSMNVDVEKMKRVFVNIIKNGIDAMPTGGKLTLASREANGDLEIAFSDTGTGMSKSVVEKIWDPLFTTKARGVGLGLSISQRIVAAHGGNISVESAVDKGTTFTVTVPLKPTSEGGEKVWVNVPESLLSTTTKT